MKKLIKNSLDIVKILESLDSVLIRIDDNNHKAVIFNEDGSKYIEFSSDSLDFFDDEDDNLSNKVLFKAGDFDFKVSGLFIENKLTTIRGNQFDRVFKGKLHSYETTNIDLKKKYYHRQIIPYSKDINYLYQIADSKFQTEELNSRGCIVVKVDDFRFHLFQVKAGKQYFLIIDCLEKVDNVFFRDVVFAAIVGLGFVTSHFVQNYSYTIFFKNRDDEFPLGVGYSDERDSFKITYHPININPYSWLYSFREKAEEYQGKLSKLSQEEFSNLINKIYFDDRLRATILLVLESCNQSLLVMTPSMFVAIESLVNIITDEGEKIKPIKDKKLFKKMRSDFIEVINKYGMELSEETVIVLKKKVDAFNTATNKDSLKRAFQLLNIELTERELNILNDRNSFLHGRFSKDNNIEIQNISDHHIFYVALSAYVLCSILILKYVGFSGYIINFPKLYEKSTKVVIDEEYYRLI